MYLSPDCDETQESGTCARAHVCVCVYAREILQVYSERGQNAYPRHEGYCPIRDSSSAPIERLQPGFIGGYTRPIYFAARARPLYIDSRHFGSSAVYPVPLSSGRRRSSARIFITEYSSPRQPEYIARSLRFNRKLPSCRSNFIREHLTCERARVYRFPFFLTLPVVVCTEVPALICNNFVQLIEVTNRRIVIVQKNSNLLRLLSEHPV